MTIEANDPNATKKYHHDPVLDPELQKELEEALGDSSLEDLINREEHASSPGAGTRSDVGKGVRKGKVLAIQGDDIFVEMGGKSQGVLPASHFAEEPLPNVGDMINVTIDGYNAAEGLLNLSRFNAIMAASWDTLHEGQIVEGRVTGSNKGGLELIINGIRAFMPISQIELFRVEDLAPYENQKFRCKVTEIDPAEENLIVSRRTLLEEEAAVLREQAWETITEGKIVAGVVRNIMPYGAFVDIGGVDGLLHVADMSHARLADPHEAVKEGQEIQVKILKIDREARKVSLGLKQVMPDPWDSADTKYTANDVVTARITRLADFGAFAELEPGIEGLIPMGEMSFTQRVKSAGDLLQAGQTVRLRVMSVDKDRRRVSLSLKRAGEDPWTGASVRWPAGAIVDGVVKRISEFGAFVELTPGVEGLVHISELSANRIRSVSETVKEGQPVQVKVLGVDEEKRRVSLSIKQVVTAPEYTGPAAPAPAPGAPPAEPPPAPKKRKTPLKGGLD